MRKLISAISILLLLSSCSIKFSFTGASIPPDVKNVSVKYFLNHAPLAQPTLSQTFTEALKDIFLSQTNLQLADDNGDLQFSGTITNYKTSPVAIQGDETAAMNRLTIVVMVKFINTVDPTQDFESSFSRFSEYESSKSLSEVEEDLIEEINEQLVQDIFNKAVSNW